MTFQETILKRAREDGDALLAHHIEFNISKAELINLMDAHIVHLNGRIAALERLRPHWAQGHTSDGVAAQSATAALDSLWGLLCAKHQTEAVQTLTTLLARAKELEIELASARCEEPK